MSFIVEEFKNGYSVGYSANYVRVYVDKELLVGKKFDVLATSAFEDGVIADVIK